MRRNRFVRVRRYDQRPNPMLGWFDPVSEQFCDAQNPHFERDKRMISWRRWS